MEETEIQHCFLGGKKAPINVQPKKKKNARESHCSDFTSEYASEISMLYTKIQNQLDIHDDIKMFGYLYRQVSC